MKLNLKAHSGTICAVCGIIGVGVTAFLSYRAGRKAEANPAPENETKKEKAKRVVKTYGPAVASGVATGVLIFAGDRIHIKKEMALGAAVAMWKEGYLDLDKVVSEKVGDEERAEIDKELKKKLDPSEKTDASKLANRIKVYEPYTKQYIYTTRESVAWITLEANKCLNKNWECNINVICKGLGGKCTEEGELYRWTAESESQVEAWGYFGMGPWIDIQLIPMQEGPEEVLAIDYTVPPERPYYEDKLYKEATN